MTKNIKTDWYVSSTGQGLSLTIKGALMALVPLILFWAKAKGLPLSEADITNTIEQITTGIAAGIVVAGLFRKAYYWAIR
jgi:hypothetical protein